MKILVIGGTAFFGKAIVNQLVAAGHDVSVMSRGNQQPDVLGKVSHIQCDRTNREEFASKVGGTSFDIVIDNIAYNADDVTHALGALKGNMGRYIFTSTAAMYYTGDMSMPAFEQNVNHNFEPPPEERDSPLWTYTMGKTGGEKALLDQDSQEFVIIRPPIVLGPDDHTLRGYFYFQRLMDGKPIIITNAGVQSFRIVYSEDLAKGYVLCLENEIAKNNTYNIVQQEVVTLKMMLESASKALGIEPEIVDIPRSSIEQAGFEYPETYGAMQNFVIDVTKAERDLDYSTTPFNDWIKTTVLWYRDNYDGKDSANYENRDAEVAFAKRYLDAMSALNG